MRSCRQSRPGYALRGGFTCDRERERLWVGRRPGRPPSHLHDQRLLHGIECPYSSSALPMRRSTHTKARSNCRVWCNRAAARGSAYSDRLSPRRNVIRMRTPGFRARNNASPPHAHTAGAPRSARKSFREPCCAKVIFGFVAHNHGASSTGASSPRMSWPPPAAARNRTMTFDHPATTLDLM